ncbi:hypothetical protein [Mesorhizobium sp.]|uniref:hypothetical protein n=1 Tax=Mesorhizobium sp. TaxID=1871066 RepID=UPI000FE6746D|nr:hypothetical protein [Mesorhizobium sp.]RWC55161.1 MAG: hypothetical protein EOS56_27180 [Mesorhizobium sp.]RWC60151.1 MAG: hypothetical protein EOS29_20780 [Mesorhizobium sp.]
MKIACINLMRLFDAEDWTIDRPECVERSTEVYDPTLVGTFLEGAARRVGRHVAEGESQQDAGQKNSDVFLICLNGN